MKTRLIIIPILFIFITSIGCQKKDCCKNKQKIASNEVPEKGKYQCPMECEGEKRYESSGKCPVCQMELSQINSNKKQDCEQSEIIQLNDGEKWAVNPEMMVHIKNMDKEISIFKGGEQQNYNSLAKSLQKHIDLLTASCTMKGEAHDELHKWLLPFIDLVNNLSKSNNIVESSQTFAKIKDSMADFKIYFE